MTLAQHDNAGRGDRRQVHHIITPAKKIRPATPIVQGKIQREDERLARRISSSSARGPTQLDWRGVQSVKPMRVRPLMPRTPQA